MLNTYDSMSIPYVPGDYGDGHLPTSDLTPRRPHPWYRGWRRHHTHRANSPSAVDDETAMWWSIQWPEFETHAGKPFMTTPARPHRGDQPREICATAVARCAKARARPAALSGPRTRLEKTPSSHLSNLTLSSDHQPNIKTSNLSNDHNQGTPSVLLGDPFFFENLPHLFGCHWNVNVLDA